MPDHPNTMGLAAHCNLLTAISCAVLLAVTGCGQNGGPSNSEVKTGSGQAQSIAETPAVAPEDGPLLLQEEEPLLLLEEEPGSSESSKPVADNSRCFVCHANYLDEAIAVTHAGADIGCADCHGPSDAHIADESWGSGGNGTAPDIMYPKEKINPACMHCHPRSELDAAQHEPVFATTAGKPKVCTDCHGEHRLAVRRCTWK